MRYINDDSLQWDEHALPLIALALAEARQGERERCAKRLVEMAFEAECDGDIVGMRMQPVDLVEARRLTSSDIDAELQAEVTEREQRIWEAVFAAEYVARRNWPMVSAFGEEASYRFAKLRADEAIREFRRSNPAQSETTGTARGGKE
jgi:hypothetical protein